MENYKSTNKINQSINQGNHNIVFTIFFVFVLGILVETPEEHHRKEIRGREERWGNHDHNQNYREHTRATRTTDDHHDQEKNHQDNNGESHTRRGNKEEKLAPPKVLKNCSKKKA